MGYGLGKGQRKVKMTDICERQHKGQEQHWWYYSKKCVGLICSQTDYQIKQTKLTSKSFILAANLPTKLTLSVDRTEILESGSRIDQLRA